MSEKIVFSNKITKAVKGRLDVAIKRNGHTIGFVLEKLIMYYVKYGLPEKGEFRCDGELKIEPGFYPIKKNRN